MLYEGEKGVDSNVVILNDVHVDIMDYIKPAQCTETQFRTMWTEFEWENKVNINSKAKTLREFLKQLMACTNMSCLTPEASMKGDCQFLSANLYARSVFGKLIFLIQSFKILIMCRRGRSGQPEYRKGRRERSNHWVCTHSQSIARVSVELGVAEGVEQSRRCMSGMLVRYDYDNAVRQQKFGRRSLESSLLLIAILAYVVKDIESLQKPRVELDSPIHLCGRHQVLYLSAIASHVHALLSISRVALNTRTRHCVTRGDTEVLVPGL